MNLQTPRIEKRFHRDGRMIRFTNFIDEESFEFEKKAKTLLPEAPLEQQLDYLSQAKKEIYLLQVLSRDGEPALQASAFIARPKLFRGFGMATVPNFSSCLKSIDEEFALKLLAELIADIPGVVLLRVEPFRMDAFSLNEFQENAEKSGYFHSLPLARTKTLICDLMDSEEILLKSLPQKTRAKVRNASRAQVKIESLTDPKFENTCTLAMNESRKRSGGGHADYDFKAAFKMARNHPDCLIILGLFLLNEPSKLLAYAIGYRSGDRCEFNSAGALGNPELRALPYNYFLLWELMRWGRSMGSKTMDLGGITSGDPKDPLLGISRFKRSFTSRELEVSREMVRIVRPIRFTIYCILKSVISLFRFRNQAIPVNKIKPKNRMGMVPTYD